MFTNLDASTTHSHLIPPHGGELVNLNVDGERAAELKAQSRDFPSWNLTARHIRDLELLLNGAFSPLRGFMTMADYEGVCHNMRLTSGVLWPIPITLDITESFAKALKPGSSKIALRDAEGVMLAVLHVEDVWQPDRKAEAKAVFNTTSPIHPGVNELLNKAHARYVGGRIEGLQPPSHYDFKNLRLTPAELRIEFARLGWRRVVAFQTRNPMHRAHVELTLRAAKQVEANLLIHPSVGVTKLGDVDYFTRVRCYKLLLVKQPHGTAKLSLLRQGFSVVGHIPACVTWHEVVQEVPRSFPPRHKQGLTVFFTGLSGSGKSTIASVLVTKLLEVGGRPVTLLDGDLVRKHLSSELGFSREHRDLNIHRIGYVASEITKNGGIAICAPIAPYDSTRKHVRSMIEPLGGFIMVHLSTPVDVCEQRDRKGLYAKARAGRS